MLKVKGVAFLRIYLSFSPALCDSFCTHTCIFISHEINMNLHILLVCMCVCVCVCGGGGGGESRISCFLMIIMMNIFRAHNLTFEAAEHSI